MRRFNYALHQSVLAEMRCRKEAHEAWELQVNAALALAWADGDFHAMYNAYLASADEDLDLLKIMTDCLLDLAIAPHIASDVMRGVRTQHPTWQEVPF